MSQSFFLAFFAWAQPLGGVSLENSTFAAASSLAILALRNGVSDWLFQPHFVATTSLRCPRRTLGRAFLKVAAPLNEKYLFWKRKYGWDTDMGYGRDCQTSIINRTHLNPQSGVLNPQVNPQSHHLNPQSDHLSPQFNPQFNQSSDTTVLRWPLLCV